MLFENLEHWTQIMVKCKFILFYQETQSLAYCRMHLFTIFYCILYVLESISSTCLACFFFHSIISGPVSHIVSKFLATWSPASCSVWSLTNRCTTQLWPTLSVFYPSVMSQSFSIDTFPQSMGLGMVVCCWVVWWWR